jgi:hypothetical protein
VQSKNKKINHVEYFIIGAAEPLNFLRGYGSGREKLLLL